MLRNLRFTLFPCLLVFALLSCSAFEYPLIDLRIPDYSGTPSIQIDSNTLTVSILPGVSAVSQFERLPNYNVDYQLIGAEQQYTKAVIDSFGQTANPSRSTEKGHQLILTSLIHNLFVHDNSGLPVATDEISAEWKLLDLDGNQIAEYFFIGQHTAKTEWGTSAFAKSAQVRGLEAMRKLYRNTTEGLALAPDIRALATQ